TEKDVFGPSRVIGAAAAVATIYGFYGAWLRLLPLIGGPYSRRLVRALSFTAYMFAVPLAFSWYHRRSLDETILHVSAQNAAVMAVSITLVTAWYAWHGVKEELGRLPLRGGAGAADGSLKSAGTVLAAVLV